MVSRLPRLKAAFSGRVLWTKVGVVGFLTFAIALATGYYFATVHEEIYFRDTGRLLDCGTVFSPSSFAPSSLAAASPAACGPDATRDDLIGLVLMVLLGAIGVAAMVVATIRQRSRV